MSRGINFGVAVALGSMAALTGGFGVLLETGIRAHAPVERYAHTAAVVSGQQNVSITVKSGSSNERYTEPLVERSRIPVADAASLRGVPGVTNVIADYSFPVMTLAGTLTAHGWDAATLLPASFTSGRAPQSSHDVVLDAAGAAAAKVQTGDTVKLQMNGTPQAFKVSGLLNQGSGSGAAAGSSAGAGTSSGTVYFSQAEAASLSGHPETADALLVTGKHVSTSALQAAAPGAVVATGDARGDVESLAVKTVRTNLIGVGGSLGGTSVLVALLVVTGLLELSVRSRTRELAVMRAVGALPRQVRRLIVRETLRVAVPAAVIGGLASLGVGALLHSVMVSQGFLPASLALSLSPIPAIAGALITVSAAVGSAWLASRRVSKIKPVQALGESMVEPTKLAKWRVATGTVFLALGLTLGVLTSIVGGQAAAASVAGLVVSLIWAVALLGPVIARAGISLLGLPIRILAPITGRLAAAGSRAAAVRMAAVITPVALAVSFGGTQLLAQESATAATQQQSVDGVLADQVLVSSGPGVPHSAYDAVTAIPGVTGATAVKRTTVVMPIHALGDTSLESLSAQGLSGSTTTVDPKVTSGSLADLTGTDTIALSSTIADNAKLGSEHTVYLGDGTEIHPKLVAVYDRGLGFGDVLLPHDTVAPHTTTPDLDDDLLVSGKADLSSVTGQYAGVHATSKADYGKALIEQARQNGVVNLIAVVAIAGFILIGLVTTLAVATASRRRELTLYRLIGATRKQMMRTMRLETAIILGTGTLAGTAVAGATLAAFAGGVTAGTLSLPPLLCAAIVAAAAIPGSAAVLLTARSILGRGSPKIQ